VKVSCFDVQPLLPIFTQLSGQLCVRFFERFTYATPTTMQMPCSQSSTASPLLYPPQQLSQHTSDENGGLLVTLYLLPFFAEDRVIRLSQFVDFLSPHLQNPQVDASDITAKAIRNPNFTGLFLNLARRFPTCTREFLAKKRILARIDLLPSFDLLLGQPQPMA
jgi:hypothetical protein